MTGWTMQPPLSGYNKKKETDMKSNKKLRYGGIWLGIAIFLTSCHSDMDTATDMPTEALPGEPVSVYFSTLTAQVSRAAAGNSLPQPLTDGTRFHVYAYTENNEPAEHKTYAVGINNTTSTAEADAMKLYRGTYHFYFISDNTSGTPQPEATNGIVTVSNGTDFIYTTLKNVVVQSETGSTGSSSITIPVNTPFNHLCSQVSVAVKADSKQPKKIETLTVNSIKMKNLSSDRTYTLGNTTWNLTDSPTYTTTPGSPQWNSFTENNTTENGATSYLYESNTPYMALPTDGSAELAFEVNLTIGYTTTSNTSTSENKTYEVSLPKSLLPGTKYRIEFSLTFFGDLAATDVALTVKAYDERELTTDEIGGDEE